MQPDWEIKYAIRDFKDFAQDVNAAPLQAARNVIDDAFGGKLVLLKGPVGSGKSSLLQLLLERRNCHRFADHPFDACHECPGCLSVRRGEQTPYDMVRRFGPADGNVGQLVAESIEIWSGLRARLAQAHGQFVLAFDDVDGYRSLDLRFLQDLIDQYGGSGVLFILVTSIAESLPPSLLSRAEIIHLEPPTREELVAWLASILSEEGIESESEFLPWLVSCCSRCPRLILKRAGQLARLTRSFNCRVAKEMLGLQ